MEQVELRRDREELMHLRSMAKQPRVISFVSSETYRVDAKLSEMAAAAVVAASAPASVEEASAVAPTPLSYTNISSFSWDQDNDKIKIYVFLEGVEQEKVVAVCKSMSVDIRFHDVQGKNYRCSIPKLNKEISPDKCKMLVKPNKVIITLFKASKGNWLDLHFKEDKLKPSMDKGKDPMAGIMDLMKNMDEEGDEDMKRVIAKSWSEARSGKAADTLRGFP